MKVAELRAKLATLKKEEIIKLSVEFYKLVPKAKKVDYDLDNLVNNPNQKSSKTNVKTIISLADMELDIPTFIFNAKEQYCLYPNQIISKKQRSTWRFKVKAWYKGLIDRKRNDADLNKQAALLKDLYNLLCESSSYVFFNTYNAFGSVGYEQIIFYRASISLLQESKGKIETVKEAIELIINNGLNPNTTESDLMIELIETFENTDLKYKGIEVVEALIKEIGFSPQVNDKSNVRRFSKENYDTQKKQNNLAELGLRLYLGLYENEEAIAFYYKHYYDGNLEIKLFVLIRILFELRKKELLLQTIQKAEQQGIKPRESLKDLIKYIKDNNELPRRM